MISGLQELRARFVFELRVVDVDADPVLARRFGEHVPVLMHGEHELCRHHLQPASVSAYLAKMP
jgi:thioredoxin reductase (NADPH)